MRKEKIQRGWLSDCDREKGSTMHGKRGVIRYWPWVQGFSAGNYFFESGR
ncbi:hypothetical protein [Cyclobacterium xiamenense]